MLAGHGKSIFNMSKTSSKKDNGLQPEDTIMRCSQSNGIDSRSSDKADLLATYSNFPPSFSLRDLAIIAKIVVDSADSYLLLVQQCYWFTRTLVGISIAHSGPQSIAVKDENAYDRSGRINRLPFIPTINEDNPSEIAKLVTRVHKEIEDDNKQVC